AMLLAAGMKAEESRREYGHPGAAGYYVFVLAVAQGVVVGCFADSLGEVVLRIILPPLAVGLWWVILLSPRATDSDEIKEKLERRRSPEESEWAWTPETWLVQRGIKKPQRV